MGMELILASASPRRSQLLRQIGVDHRVVAADIDEQWLPGESALECVQRLAMSKARHVAAGVQRCLVLGADTAVVIDGQVMGKPRDGAHLIDMLTQLSGRVHRVLSALALVTVGEHGKVQRAAAAVSESEVEFRSIGAQEMQRYWDSGEPRDKAGGYAIQGMGAVFVRRLSGSYSGVMGLPLFETAALLHEAGFSRG